MSEQLSKATAGLQKTAEAQKREREDSLLKSNKEYTPLKKTRAELAYSKTKNHLLKKFKENQIEQLEQEFITTAPEKSFIEDFFKQESHAIIHWLLISSSNNRSFEFISTVIPHDIFKYKLRDEKFALLRRTLSGRAYIEEQQGLTMQERELDRDRFGFLIKIDPDGIEEFMEKNKNEFFMKQSILEDYEMAKKDGKPSPSISSPKQSPKPF